MKRCRFKHPSEYHVQSTEWSCTAFTYYVHNWIRSRLLIATSKQCKPTNLVRSYMPSILGIMRIRTPTNYI